MPNSSDFIPRDRGLRDPWASTAELFEREDELQPQRTPSRGRAGWLVASTLALILIGLGGMMAWRWADTNLLRWGVQDAETTAIDSARLIERVRAFQLATVKHTYAGSATIDADKTLAAGPVRLGLPGWVAGQELSVTGDATVTAGVDLARVSPDDMQITRQGKEVNVLIRLPAPEILSTELLPNTLDMNTSAGVLTRIKQRVGLSEADLRDRAADQVIGAARDAAVRQGILDEAARESEKRLQAFLQSMPQTGQEKVTYAVVVRAPATQ